MTDAPKSKPANPHQPIRAEGRPRRTGYGFEDTPSTAVPDPSTRTFRPLISGNDAHSCAIGACATDFVRPLTAPKASNAHMRTSERRGSDTRRTATRESPPLLFCPDQQSTSALAIVDERVPNRCWDSLYCVCAVATRALRSGRRADSRWCWLVRGAGGVRIPAASTSSTAP